VDNWACENGLNDLSQAMREAYGLAQSGKDTGQARTVALPVPASYTGEPLFQVSAGIPAGKALDTASLYLAAALDLARDAVDENSGDGDNAVPYLIRMAKSVVDSVNTGLAFILRIALSISAPPSSFTLECQYTKQKFFFLSP
jgi:hypothetical protein